MVGLVAPCRPVVTLAAREHLQAGTPAAGFDQFILLVGLAAVFAFAGCKHVDLAAAGGEGAAVLAADAEQEELGDVAEVEASLS